MTGAADITLLTPQENSVIYAREPQTHFVLRLASEKDVKKLRLRQGDLSHVPFLVKPASDGIYVHYKVELQPGENIFEILPGSKRVSIRFNLMRSLLAVRFDDQKTFLFHRRDVVPEACRKCHNEQSVTHKGAKPFYGEFSPLCTSCHKELVSKSLWQHSPAANMLCGTCHQPWGNKERVVMYEGRIDTLCFRCHFTAAKWQRMRHLHGPVGTGDCTVCHDPHGDRYPNLLWADGGMSLCLNCHVDMKNYGSDSTLKHVHGIIKGQGCVACHSPHATDNSFQLHKPINELCSSCHTRFGEKKDHPVKKHPVAGKPDPRRKGRTLVCTSCHNPHGSDFKFMLIDSPLGNQVCRQCHKIR